MPTWLPTVYAPDHLTAYDQLGRVVDPRARLSRVVEYVRVDAARAGADDAASTAARRTLLDARGQDEVPAHSRILVPGFPGRSDVTVALEVTLDEDTLTYIDSVLPLDDDGNVVGGDDLVAQTEQIYANADRLLRAKGLGIGDVVKTQEFALPSTRRQYRGTGAVRKAHLSPPYGGGTGILMDTVGVEGALMQIEFVAATAPRTIVNPGWSRYERLTYNPGLQVGDQLVLSGQAALDVETEQAVLPGDVVAQAEYTWANILTVLASTGAGPEHIVRAVEYVCPGGLDRYDACDAVRPPVPALTQVACSTLLRPEFEIEIDVHCVMP